MIYSQKYMTELERTLIWSKLNKRMQLVMKIMYYTGIRISETLRIRAENINYQEGTIIIPTQKNKTLINEVIIIPEPLLKPLITYLAFYEQDIINNNNWVFFSTKKPGSHVTLNSIESIVRTARIKAGLQDNTVYKVSRNGKKYHRLSCHTHKNESIRHIYNRTGDLRKAQAQGHHTNINTTLRYIGNPLTDIELKKNIAKNW